MKTLKSLLMLCAGLSFCACSSDNEPQFPEGTGRVEISIVPPTTRALTTATSGTNNLLKVTGEYTVTLYAQSILVTTGEGEAATTTTKTSHAISFTPSESNTKAVFTGVTNPTKVTVSLNGGKKDYSGTPITELNEVTSDGGTSTHISASQVPVYGESSTFSLTTDASSTTKYTTTVTMAIPVARLEIGNITISNVADFNKLVVAGVYMDNLRKAGGTYSSNIFTASDVCNNYYFSTGTDESLREYGKEEGESNYILGDVVESGNFKDATNAINQLPESGKVYAYNFYGAANPTVYPPGTDAKYTANPQFKICFSETQLTSEANAIPRYAMITTYKSNNNPIVLENGKIYKIESAALSTQNLVYDEDGEAVAYAVEVEVTEAQWTIVDTTADWAQ